jgi:hypothetical protein
MIDENFETSVKQLDRPQIDVGVPASTSALTTPLASLTPLGL